MCIDSQLTNPILPSDLAGLDQEIPNAPQCYDTSHQILSNTLGLSAFRSGLHRLWLLLHILHLYQPCTSSGCVSSYSPARSNLSLYEGVSRKGSINVSNNHSFLTKISALHQSAASLSRAYGIWYSSDLIKSHPPATSATTNLGPYTNHTN